MNCCRKVVDLICCSSPRLASEYYLFVISFISCSLVVPKTQYCSSNAIVVLFTTLSCQGTELESNLSTLWNYHELLAKLFEPWLFSCTIPYTSAIFLRHCPDISTLPFSWSIKSRGQLSNPLLFDCVVKNNSSFCNKLCIIFMSYHWSMNNSKSTYQLALDRR